MATPFDARLYGVPTDGVTDAYTTMAALFAAAPAGATVKLPRGTVLLRTPITIAVDHLTIDGSGCTLISDGASQDRKFTISGRTGIKFRDLKINGGNYTTHTLPTAFDSYSPRETPGTIHFHNSTNCDVENCHFSGVNWPITGLGASNYINISLCSFEGYMSAIYGYVDQVTYGNPDQPYPKYCNISHNRFLAGKYPCYTLAPSGGPRNFTVQDINCTGAIKFRLRLDVDHDQDANHVIHGNIIHDSGQMGIELQGGCNNCSVVGNLIENVVFGVSLSYTERTTIAGCVIKNFHYAGVEMDGLQGVDQTVRNADPRSNEQNVVTGCTFDGRDIYGRPANYYHGNGVVLTGMTKNVLISACEFKWLKVGLSIQDYSHHISIRSCKIYSNDESNYGPAATGNPACTTPILIRNADNIEVSDTELLPVGTGYQSMAIIDLSTKVRFANCKVRTNSIGYYIRGSSQITVDGGEIIAGTPAGFEPSFTSIETSNGSVSEIVFTGVKFIGAMTNGAILYSPANTLSNVRFERCDTRLASSTNAFLRAETAGAGVITGLRCIDNLGPDNSPLKNLSIPVFKDSVTINDGPEKQFIIASTNTLVNLESPVGHAGKRKVITLDTDSATATVRPKAGTTIRGSGADILLTERDVVLELISDGTQWLSYWRSNTERMQKISSVSATVDFGTVTANQQAYVTVTMDLKRGNDNRPSVAVGWSGNLPVGVVFKQAYVSAYDTALIVIHNTTGSDVVVGSIGVRVTAFQY